MLCYKNAIVRFFPGIHLPTHPPDKPTEQIRQQPYIQPVTGPIILMVRIRQPRDKGRCIGRLDTGVNPTGFSGTPDSVFNTEFRSPD